MRSETVKSNRDILLLKLRIMAIQLGETEACEFAVALHGTMLGQPIGAVRLADTDVEAIPIDPAKVREPLSYAQVTPVDYKLKFCIAQNEDCVYVSFNDLACTSDMSGMSGMAASWCIALDGSIETIDYVLS